MTGHEENFNPVGNDGAGSDWQPSDTVTPQLLNELEKRIGDELKKLKAGVQHNGVIEGLAVTERGTGANQSVDVAAGSCVVDGVEYTETSTVNVALDAADATYARWDLVTYDTSAGNPSKVTGTPNAVPTIPDIPSGDIVLALVLRAANDNVVSDAEITDKRVFVLRTEIAITVSDTLIHSNDTERSSTSEAWIKLKEIKIPRFIRIPSSFRIKFNLRTNFSFGSGRLYKNGVAVGTDQATGSTTGEIFTEDISDLEANDLIQIYTRASSGDGNTVTVKDFRLYGTETIIALDYTNNDP